MSYSDEQTDKQLKALEKKITEQYKKAYKEMRKKAIQYFKTYAKREAELIEGLENGSVHLLPNETPEEYLKKWRQAQLGRGEHWIACRDQMADRLGKANEIASAYINDDTPSIYSLNANYEAFQIATETGTLQSSWGIINEQTIKMLIEGKTNVTEFKTTSTNPKRDYEWNSKQIQKALTAGIIQGKDIKGLTDSFMSVMKSNRSSAIRNARTSYTSAQNAGRLTSMKKAQDMGIKIQKQWDATLDDRTRFSHAMLNGQIRDIDKAFSNGLMQPADSDGAPAEVYNCRCTMHRIYPKYEKVQSVERWEEMSPQEKADEKKRYKEWQKEQSQIHKSKQTDFQWSK